MAKSPVFWIWIGSTAVAALVNVAWSQNPKILGPAAILGVNLLATAMTAVFVGRVALKGLRNPNLEEGTTKD